MNKCFQLFAISIAVSSAWATAQECDLGDVNLDGQVNFADVLPFQDILESGVYQCEADSNYDGAVNLLDVVPLLDNLLSQQNPNFIDATTEGPGDFFWSTQPLGFQADNGPLEISGLYAGHSVTLYLYYSIGGNAGEVNVGAAINVATSTPGVIQFDHAGSYNYSIEIAGTPVLKRWMYPDETKQELVFQPASSIDDELVVGITAGGALVSNGMVESNTTGDPFLDAGYSVESEAFLFGKVEFTAVGGGTVNLIAGPNDLGVANGYDLLDVSFASVTIHSILPGDVNLDQEVNLLDVQPFVNLLLDGGYQAEADCNYDGEFDLLDVAPFIDKLVGS